MFRYAIKLCDAFLQSRLASYDLIVYKDGQCALRHMNGYTDVESKTPVNGNEKYNIYSCSKVITCTLAMMLYERGLFSLDDELSRYMPEFRDMTVATENGIKKAQNPILIRHLLEMTAGFSYNCRSDGLLAAVEETNGRCPTRETMKYLAKEPLSFEPGERWQYSLCHDVLAALCEEITGVRFEALAEKYIFSPCGMNDTTFMLPEDKTDSVCTLYCLENGKFVKRDKHIIPYKLGAEYASGGAGGVSTADDYIKFAEALRTGKLLREDTLRLMSTGRLEKSRLNAYWHGDNYGYGLGVRCPSDDKNYTDFGWDGAAGSYVAIDTENGISVFLATHMLSSGTQPVYPFLFRLIRTAFDGNKDVAQIKQALASTHSISL